MNASSTIARLECEAKACDKCPWTQKGQPDLTPDLRKAAVEGAWFCCHVHLGTCFGAHNYARAKRAAFAKAEGQS